MKKVLVVGVTPPPYMGQAMMTERLVNARLDNIKIYHVRMSFSSSMSSIGKVEFGKIIHMFAIVFKSIYYRFRYNVPTLYYMPGGSTFVPIARDIFMLFFLRLVFSKTIFHFRAAGVSEIVEQQPILLKKLAQYAYRSPDLAIHLSSLNPDDGGYFKAKKVAVVPNGLEDAAISYLPLKKHDKDYVSVLFVGVLQETKGVMVLLEAANLLHKQGYKLKINLVGVFASECFRKKALRYLIEHKLEEVVFFPGEKKGDEKWRYFVDADIFCFPSFYESESFGNVIAEAMMFELPVVATKWRGIPDLIEENQTGMTVSTRNPQEVATMVEKLIIDSDLRIQYGRSGRNRFLSKYQLDSFILNLQNHFISV